MPVVRRGVLLGERPERIGPFPIRPYCGSNSVVECNLAKVDVAGSNPVSRSEEYAKVRVSRGAEESQRAGTHWGAPSESRLSRNVERIGSTTLSPSFAWESPDTA